MPAETDPATAALSDEEAAAEARRIIADFATSYRDTSPIPQHGTAPPVTQPGRPPMSPRAVDDTARMLGASVLIATTGGAATAVLWASGYADPTVVVLVFGAPAALVLALARLAKRARGVLPAEHHHRYEGPVYQDQRNVHSSTRGVWARTNNRG